MEKKAERRRKIIEQIEKVKRTGEDRGLRTVNKCLAMLASLFKYAIALRWTNYNPTLGVKSLKRVTSWDDDENGGIVEENILRPEEIGRPLDSFGETEERWRMIVMTAILTGLRQGELLGLKWTDIDYGHLMNPVNSHAADKLATLALGGQKNDGSKMVAGGVGGGEGCLLTY